MNFWGNESYACNLTGPKFNPLLDPSEVPVPVWTGWSYALPPSDYYGEIQPFTTDESGNATINQDYFLQNLEGAQTLIGRSISLVKKATSADEKDKV